jgi:hypothetical protein
MEFSFSFREREGERMKLSTFDSYSGKPSQYLLLDVGFGYLILVEQCRYQFY